MDSGSGEAADSVAPENAPDEAFAAEAADAPHGGPPEPDGAAQILLFMRPGRDRDLLTEALSDRFRVEATTDVETLESRFDCCVFDTQEFNRVAGTIQRRRKLSASAFLPFVLLASDESLGPATETAWNYVDDVIELPVRKRALRSRIANLVERRRTSLRLAARERKLAETVEDLRLKERAMDEAPVGITIAEAGEDGDDPLVYVNEGFETLTGYGSAMLGEDCRFLQGEGTDPETTAAIREAIADERPISVDVLNYRKNGQTFWNRLTVAPIRDGEDEVTHFVGFQTDITDRKIRERRLEVMNRVLNHNLRNKMNLITGYTELLRSDLDDENALESLEVIGETTDDLMRIAEAARKIEYTLSDVSQVEDGIDLREQLLVLSSRMRDRFPEATLTLSLPDDDPIETRVVGLVTAIEEGVENAVKHNDDPRPSVDVRVSRQSSGWIAIEIADDGPGIPDHETQVLERGETSLTHADRLGIWLIYWVVNKAGGKFTVDTSSEGTTLRLTVPANP
ncbi:PAS domain-containing protein [Halorubrum sp. AD140]|uniref:PAS domain-containing protein n=1 Tax=Halorubrum sp. AD140 TaxID=3050073 RepID=UPI002ACC7192|nr:PAS domain-containing protein [Halorubrum sp. AD140]MDZ5812703.1 PAS domain-containing protein [Halorubrum sp. AD140]